MKNKYIKLYSLILALLIFFKTDNIFSNIEETEEQVLLLHKKISGDLLSVKKQFPQSQPIVYSLLDQVYKMYKISKNINEENKKLKYRMEEKNEENNSLKTENISLKNEINNLKNELSTTQQNLTTITKNVEQKNTLLSYLAKEKAKLTGERNQLLQKVEKIQNQTIQSHESKESKIAHPEKRELNFNNNQSLNLTSTSDPSSPN